MFHSYDTRNKSDLINTSHNTKLLERSTAYLLQIISWN